jgi:phospholipid/cholesterol/gamma-HCH transport system substrate-binding protein
LNLLRAAELKVGALVLSIASLIAFMSLRVSDDPSFLGHSNDAWFLLSNAGGLVKNSAIRMAGIPMGVIKDIKLQDGMARVEITIRPDVQPRVSASVEIKSQGILGDKHVEFSPGSPSDPPLAAHGQILNVKDQGNLDSIINQIGDIAGNLKEVAQVLKESVVKDGTHEHILGRIVQNIEKLTKDLSEVTTDNKEKVGEIVDKVNNITGALDEALNDDSDEGFKVVWKKTMSRIDSITKNLDDITGKINRGEGTIGKLVSDEETSEKVSNAVDGISNLIEAGSRLTTSLDLASSYMTLANGQETSLNVKIQPGLDRYYLVGVVSDPFGQVTVSKTQTSGTSNSNYTTTMTYQNALKWNLEFAKIFYDFTLRGGLIENYGGLALDYTFLHSKAVAGVEVNNFSSVNLRPFLKYNFWKGVYVTGGIYDAMNSSGFYSPYIGAGLFLTNDDLKLLLAKSPL